MTQPVRGFVPVGIAFLVLGATSAAQAAPSAKPGATVGILFTPYKTYRDAASEMQSVLTADGYRCVLAELPADSERSSEEGPPATRGPATASVPGSSVPAVRLASATEAALRTITDAKPAVVVACGATATSLALSVIPKVPVVFCLVPNALDMPFLEADSPDRSRVVGVTTDVSPADQVTWMARLCPNARNIGVLCSERSRRTAEALRAAAQQRSIAVQIIEANKDEFPKAVEALNSKGCTGMLMLPDAAIYNSANVQRLLLWGIRQQKPVFAFSANIVKAGAFAGQYADTEALGKQTIELVRKVLKGTDASTARPEYPRQVQTAINERTAEMIGVSISSDVLAGVSQRYGKAQ